MRPLFPRRALLSGAAFNVRSRGEYTPGPGENCDANLGEIADAVGFASADYFRLAFRKAYGLPPRHFRREAER